MSVRSLALVGSLLACSPRAPEQAGTRTTSAPSRTRPEPGALARARALIDRGELRAARQLLGEALRLAPADELRCLLTELATSLGDYAAADGLLRELRQGGCDLGRLRADLARAPQVDAPSAHASIEAGQHAMARGELIEAQRSFDRGVSVLERLASAAVAAEPLRRFEPSLLALAGSPSGQWLAASDRQGLSVLDARFDERLRLPFRCQGLAWQTEASLLCGASDGRVLAIDVEHAHARELARLPGPATTVSSRGERWLATGGGEALLAGSPGGVTPVGVKGATAGAFSSDGRTIGVGSSDGSVTLLDAATLATRRRIAAPPERSAVVHLSYSADDVWLGVSFAEGPARVIGTDTGRLRALVPATGQFHFAADGRRLVAAGTSYALSAPLRDRAVASGAPVTLSASKHAAIWLREDGALLQAGFDGEDARVLRAAPAQLDHAWSLGLEALLAATAHAGRYAEADTALPPNATGCGDDRGVLSHDRRYELCERSNHQLELIDAASRRSRWRIDAPILPIGVLDVSTSREVVLVGSARGAATLLGLARGTVLASVWSVAQVKDGEGYALRGYATDPAGRFQVIGPDAAPREVPARCAIGPWRVAFAACRKELLDPQLLGRALQGAAASLQK